MASEKRTQFTFYESFAKAIKRIRKDADRAKAYDAIVNYALYGEEPDLDALPDAAAIAFELAKPNLDSARRMSQGGRKRDDKACENPEENNERSGQGSAKVDARLAQGSVKVDERSGQGSRNKKEKEKEKEKEIENECYISCAEPNVVSAPAIMLPTNSGREYPVSQEQVTEWARLYPAVDIMQQLRAMRGWLLANPTRRKTNSGVARFINAWLAKEQNKGGKAASGSAAMDLLPPADEAEDIAYMKRLFSEMEDGA